MGHKRELQAGFGSTVSWSTVYGGGGVSNQHRIKYKNIRCYDVVLFLII